MARLNQVRIRLDEAELKDLKRVAELEGRAEQEVLRDSLRMYVKAVDEQKAFVDSVELGWYELHSGLGEEVIDHKFFKEIRKELAEKQ